MDLTKDDQDDDQQQQQQQQLSQLVIGLNQAQKEAVTAFSKGGLFVAEGPNVKLETDEGKKDDDEVEIVEPAPVVLTSKGRKGKGKAATSVKGTGKGKKKIVEVDESEEEEEEEEEEGEEQGQASSTSANVSDQLDSFLSAASLATDHDTQQAANDGKVPPCVFIPGLEDGTFPFYRASTVKEIDEERRFLYVAITRAQTHCILSWVGKRMGGGTERAKSLSPFVDKLPKRFYVSTLPKVTEQTKLEVAQVTRRSAQVTVVKEDDEVEIKPSTSGPPRTSGRKRSASDSAFRSSSVASISGKKQRTT
ncbi:hypothetical protein JCM3765_001217 [Sporobolomyces pararoseus]